MNQNMTVKIAGQVFELSESRDKEEDIRKACKEIDDTLKELRQAFPNKTISDLLALVALNLCVDNYSLRRALEQSEEDDENLHKELQRYLQNL